MCSKAGVSVKYGQCGQMVNSQIVRWVITFGSHFVYHTFKILTLWDV